MDQIPEEREDSSQLQEKYANYFRIGHNEHEFFFDFGVLREEDGEARYHTRIITAPRYARELARLLFRSLSESAAMRDDPGQEGPARL